MVQPTKYFSGVPNLNKEREGEVEEEEELLLLW